MRRNISVSVSCNVIALANVGLFFESQGIPLASTRSGLVRQALQFLADTVADEGSEQFATVEAALTFLHARDLNEQRWKSSAKNLKQVVLKAAQKESEEPFNTETSIQEIRKELQKGE